MPQRKLDVAAAWEDALFSKREQAALAFTEQVTLISQDGISDEVWSELTAVFAPTESAVRPGVHGSVVTISLMVRRGPV